MTIRKMMYSFFAAMVLGFGGCGPSYMSEDEALPTEAGVIEEGEEDDKGRPG